MVEIIDTSTLVPNDYEGLNHLSIYNGLDCCVTSEVHDVIESQLDPNTQLIYNFERACQAPALEMMLRGIRVDNYERFKLLHFYENQKERMDTILQKYAWAMNGQTLNPQSPKQMKEFFYDFMGLPEQYKFDKGVRKVTCNRAALEALQAYRYARPVINVILKMRDLQGFVSVLRTGVDTDGRMRFGFNVAGTETGRWSSNENAFGSGMNGQNITDKLRRIFVADDGYKMAYADLEQAESRVVAYIAEDLKYIEACESDDLHTYVAKIIWDSLNWSGDSKLDKDMAEEKFWRHWSRRDLAKRGGHLTNYYGQPQSNAKNLHLDIETMKSFQNTYLTEFSGIKKWHTTTATELHTKGFLTTPLGRRRYFFGRRYDDATLREAIAYKPQSVVGDLLNLGMYRTWRDLRTAYLLSQLHDAILVQFKEEDEDEVIAGLQKCLTIPIEINGRTMVIPVEIKVGWNWASFNYKNPKENPDGLKVCPDGDSRKRQVYLSTPLMQRQID